MPTVQSETTPNPNSLKFTTDAGSFTDGSVKAFSSPDEADGHPLGERLFAIAGVDDVFLTPDFVTVSKTSSATWSELTTPVTAALEEHVSVESS